MMRPKSSAVREIDYDETTQTLDVTFTSGQRYQYKDVPREHYRAMGNAESVGRYVAEHIKPNYTAEHQEEDE
jgi:KTSC domain